MSPIYHDGHRHLQDRFDTRRLAGRIAERVVRDHLDENNRAFLPHAVYPTPVPDWQRSDWAADVLPVSDPARAVIDGIEGGRQ